MYWLTVTLDVFKLQYSVKKINNIWRLTVTLDVFKYRGLTVWHVDNGAINSNIRCI